MDTLEPQSSPIPLSRRQLLQAGGAVLGGLAAGRLAHAQAPKPGGTLVSAQTTEATGLDPQLVPAFSRSRRSPMMYNQLVRFDPDMNPVSELAESWQVSPDGLTWTFKLREGVKFHDGQELSSADVKFTFDRLFEKSPGKSDFIAVDKVEPAGKYAVKFITKEPFAGLLAALGGFWGFIINEAGIKKHGDLNKAESGTGPFMLHDWKVEQQMVLKKHPGYFKKGQPYVDELVLRTIPDEANIVAALRTGQIHHAFIEDNKNYNLLKEERSLTGYRSSRLGYEFLNINASRGPLKDVRVRQAISWAVDRQQIMRVASAGFGRLTAPATAPMKAWQLPEDQWMRYYKPDLDRAKKLLADAGYASGFTVKLGVIPTFPTMVSGAPVVAAQLKKIGITAEIENVEYAVWIKRWLAKDFDMTMNTTPGYADPDTAFFRALHSTKGQNWNSWSVPELDALLEEGRRTMDQRKRKEIYDRIQIMILENVPHLWLFSADTIDFTQSAVKGFKQHPTTLLYGFEGVWLEKA
ncbi:MAG TPA: ABC transporter substrate-binding protein [Methylomirabilota bacterium]|jgi:peptide/nickel transport system substrate-binding protein|nr:ABC transporter substrate-binding protein [Methylomirabilota bacterium]